MLKNTFKNIFTELFTNRYIAILSIVLTLLSVAFIVYIAFAVRPSDLQLVTHYTAYGVTQLYRSQWWYLLSFAVLGALIAFFHIAIALKLFLVKGHPLAILYLWVGIGVVLFAWITSFSIITIWSPL
ncbi:hypothetical protein GW930_02615 [Candidatus Saccharibacteria bacterium]|nr:hypothetical protein [Candidatus Saccharibacteria bacterium]